MLPLAQLDLLKRQGHALAASLTLTLESDPVPAEGQVLQNAVVAQRLDELGTVTNLLLEQSGASDRDPDVSKLRDLLVALRLDACVTKEALDEFLHSSERMLFTMPAELLLSMTDRMAARHTLPTGHVYRLYRLCHQVVNRHSGAPSKSLVLRVLTSMFRFADTNETSARVLDEALQICADPRWALPRSSTPASPTSPVDDCYLEWLCARAHNRGLACIETKDTSGAEGFLSRALQLLPYTGEPFQQENHKVGKRRAAPQQAPFPPALFFFGRMELITLLCLLVLMQEISALYARALEARGKAQNEGGTAVKDLFR
uniref:Uncharacterized protein n=1 Tax=Pinguiococcus pyrenoidosus TaxID=172671 RepID=A0A7R9U339_9STRA|mmetsp:Transcript_13177/g.48896  ORF Transcript_13177/g.48896 Transcript_13177/m.48896 type:complete len:316 (+) Transcript_13177:2-949(+)